MSIAQRIVAVAFLFALSGGASAQSAAHGIYMGVGAGVSKALQPADCEPLPTLTTTSCDIQDKKTGWKLFAGYQVNQNLAFEAGYADLGKFKTAVDMASSLGPFTSITATFHPAIFSVDLVGSLPLGSSFALLGRIGYFHWTLHAISDSTAPLGSFGLEGFNETVQGNSFDIGVGAKWDFADNLGARLEYQRYPQIGNSEVGKSDVDLLSASLIYRFR